MTPHVDQIVSFFETLTPQSLARCASVYAPDARFKDPFNDVRGVPAIEAVLSHMFSTLESPRFRVLQRIANGDQCFLTWDFHFRFRQFQRGTEQTIHGGTHLQFDPQGRITLHRDYWDAAEELYEKLPAVGGLMRWLKNRANS
nr:nuclear transport factor 2 family protein [uncultured Albidiferax sp.]